MSLLYPPPIEFGFQPQHAYVDQISAIVDHGDDGISAETAVRLAQVAIQDMDALMAAQKGKLRADAPVSDEEYALRLQAESFREWLFVAQDAVLARSLGGALQTDAALLDVARVVEAAAVHDRRVAEMVERGEDLPPPTPVQQRLEDPAFVMEPEPVSVLVDLAEEVVTSEEPSALPAVDDVPAFRASIMDDLGELVSIFEEISHTNLSSKAPVAGPSVLGKRMIQCTICTGELRFDKALHTPCDHYYCRECITSYVEGTTRDEELFPIRCCLQPIPVDLIAQFITPAPRKAFEDKEAEYTVPVRERIYCVNAACHVFIGSSVGITATGVACPACRTMTCPQCKQAEHAGEDCVAVASAAQLRTLASESGWKTCPGCHMLVERTQGCPHMVCRCKVEFCYLCAQVWKTCGCPR